jgi:predicted  nucleic acid-binding Zn-ribbon protein
MLNWRRDPGYEQRVMQHKQRMKQLESEILQVRKDSEQIEKEIEQLRRENAREKALSALIRQRCFPAESSSIPPPATESDCGSSLS